MFNRRLTRVTGSVDASACLFGSNDQALVKLVSTVLSLLLVHTQSPLSKCIKYGTVIPLSNNFCVMPSEVPH